MYIDVIQVDSNYYSLLEGYLVCSTTQFFVPGKVRVAQKRVVQGTMYVMEC